MGTLPFPMLHPGEIDDRIVHEELPLAPVPVWDTPTLAACARLYHRYVEPGTGTRLPDAAFCDLPRWLFLEYLVRHCGVLLVGANEPDLAYLCPIVLARNVHGWDRPRLLGFTESMTPLFHAVRDRARLCQRSASVETVIVLRGRETDRDLARCYFGLDYRILPQAPWRSGTIYLYARPHRGALPANTPEVIGAEHDRVRSLATLSVQP